MTEWARALISVIWGGEDSLHEGTTYALIMIGATSLVLFGQVTGQITVQMCNHPGRPGNGPDNGTNVHPSREQKRHRRHFLASRDLADCGHENSTSIVTRFSQDVVDVVWFSPLSSPLVDTGMLVAFVLFTVDIVCRLCFAPGYSTSLFCVFDILSSIAVLCQVRECPRHSP